MTLTIRVQRFIEENMCAGLKLYTSWRGGIRSDSSVLDDYSFYIAALIELYNSTLEKRYLEKAENFCDETVKRFCDNNNGGFYLSSSNNTELFMNPKEIYDGAIPSGNSVMSYNLVRLYQLTENAEYSALGEAEGAFWRGIIILNYNTFSWKY